MHREDDKRVGLLSYIKGEREGRKAHDLEREAMQDPFLSDALDGYDNTVDPELDARLQRMTERVEQYNAVPLPPVAAVMMQEPPAVMQREMPASDAIMEPAMPEPEQSGSGKRRRRIVLWLSAAAVVLFVCTLPYLTVVRSVRDESLMTAENGTPESAVYESSESLEMMPELDAEPAPAPSPAPQRNMKALKRTASADVNDRLAAVAANDAAVKAAAVADAATADDAVVETAVTAAAVADDAVAVDSAVVAAVCDEPKPVGGYDAYYECLYKGIGERWVRTSGDSWIVVMSFDIDESGRPTNFIVHRSSSPDFAESLIELMKSSGDWTPQGHIPLFEFVY